MGAVGGLLAIAATVFVTRRCLVRHRTKPDPGFEVDEASEPGEVEPYVEQYILPPVTEAHGASGTGSEAPRKGNGHASEPPVASVEQDHLPPRDSLFTEDPMSILADPGSPPPRPDLQAASVADDPISVLAAAGSTLPRTGTRAAPVPEARPGSLVRQTKMAALAALTAGMSAPGAAGASADQPTRRAIHEEDAEDAEHAAVDILPPVYREAWAQRHSQRDLLEYAAVGEGSIAQDSAPPLERGD